MALQVPTADELRQMAKANFFELRDDEIAQFQSALKPIVSALQSIDEEPLAQSPHVAKRTAGERPSRQEDPLNAIVRRCSVKGTGSGKLAGKRIGVKDSVSVAGVPMTCGSHLLEGYVPDTDATIVTRMLDAGAEIVAMLNMDDCALSGDGRTSTYGPTLNPHNPAHVSGGSSSGSAAALYYDDIDLTIGADQGGSIRIPASFCGVVGIKATHSLVPYRGVASLDLTMDHVGPMGRSVADVARLLEVIAGKDPLDPRQDDVHVERYTEAIGKDINGIRLGILREGFGRDGAEADVEAAVRKAVDVLAGLGASVKEVSIPVHRDAWKYLWAIIPEGFTALMNSGGLGYHWKGGYDVNLTTALGEARRMRGGTLARTVKLMLLLGTYLNHNHHGRLYAKAQNLRRGVQASYDQVLQQVDLLVMPTTPMKAYRQDERGAYDMLGNTSPFDVTGHPAISVPCAKSNGLPVGMMLVGRHFEDALLLRAAHAYEQSVAWEKV